MGFGFRHTLVQEPFYSPTDGENPLNLRSW